MEKKFFIKSCGAIGSTAMEKKLRKFAWDSFDKTIVTEEQLPELVNYLKLMAGKFRERNPKWKAVEVREEGDTQGIETKRRVRWIYIGGSPALTAYEVRNDFTQPETSTNKTIKDDTEEESTTVIATGDSTYFVKN